MRWRTARWWIWWPFCGEAPVGDGTGSAVYNQTASHFTLRVFIRPDAEADGRLAIELADCFFADLLDPGVRVTSLDTKRAGVLATDSPLPEDTDENRRRFLQLDAALKPAYLSRESASEVMRPMLGYFYRERA